MLTHEQTTIRLRDAEISRLKKENGLLNDKIRDIKIGLVKLIRSIASDMNWLSKAKMLSLANELEEDV